MSRSASLVSTGSPNDRESRQVKVWLAAARPRTLSAAVAPVAVGTAAAGTFIAWRAVAALVVSLALQVAVNFANDLFDAKRGIDTERRVGPMRATASGLVTHTQMKVAIGIALMVAAGAGVALAAAAGWELLAVGGAALVAALAYSGGPKPYASYGMGELFVFVFFGLVATVGSTYVQDEAISRVSYVAAVPVGLLATAILVANNLRDIDTDAQAGKRTLAVRIGDRRTRSLYQALVILAFIDALAVAAVANSALPALALIAAPLAVKPVSTVLHSDRPSELIEALGATARLQLVYSLLLAVGLWAWN
jgi:1,4-dihydroxy-2-naphthoate octaprenyltransferase